VVRMTLPLVTTRHGAVVRCLCCCAKRSAGRWRAQNRPQTSPECPSKQPRKAAVGHTFLVDVADSSLRTLILVYINTGTKSAHCTRLSGTNRNSAAPLRAAARCSPGNGRDTARAGNRDSGLVSALLPTQKTPHKTNSLRRTRRAPKRHGRTGGGRRSVGGAVRPVRVEDRCGLLQRDLHLAEGTGVIFMPPPPSCCVGPVCATRVRKCI
jgi:hypothetical protein